MGGRDLSGVVGVDDHYKSGGGNSGVSPLNLGGIGDLNDIKEIETIDVGQGSRRGSFSRPNP